MPRTLSVSAERLGRRALFALALCRSALSSTASRYDVAPRAPNVSLSVAVIRRRVKQNKCSTYSSVPVLWRSDSSPLRNSQMPPNRNGSFPARHRSSTVIYSCGAAVSTTINQGTVESLLSLGKLTLHSLQGVYFFRRPVMLIVICSCQFIFMSSTLLYQCPKTAAANKQWRQEESIPH